MGPEFWVAISAVFLAGGAIGAAGTLLAQFLLRKSGITGPPELSRPPGEHEVMRRQIAELSRQMHNVDERLDFTERLLGGAFPVEPPPERFEPEEAAEEAEDTAGESEASEG